MFFILFLISAISVLVIVREIRNNRQCPSDYQLRKAILGKRDRDCKLTRGIIQHLGICEKCQNIVKDFTSK